MVDKGFLEKLVSAFGAILDYLLGLLTMGVRIVFVGWTELLERILTWMIEGASGVEVNVDQVDTTSLVDSEEYITVESIVFNKIPLFDINVFNQEVSEDHDSLGRDLTHDKDGNFIPEEKRKKSDISEDSLMIIIKQTIAGWYYTFRLLAIMVMLVLLIYIGIRIATTSIANNKALYKKVLFDWICGIILVFFMHFIILAMLTLNDFLVETISKMRLGNYTNMEVYEYGTEERAEKGVTSTDMEISIYDEVRTRAYDAKLTVGTTGMIMYMILVYYAWKFSLMYLKRYLVVAVLIIMSPIVAVSFAYNKVRTGKSVIFKKWLKELLFLILLQSIHALIYVIFFESALQISLNSIGGMIFAFVILHFMTKADDMFKKIFGIKGDLTSDVAGSKLSDLKNLVQNVPMGVVGAKMAVGSTKLAARAVTKPARMIGNAGFALAMKDKATKLDQENKARKSRGELTDKEKYEVSEIERQKKLELGAVAKKLKETGTFTEEDRNAINKLREAYPKMVGNREMTEEEYTADFLSNIDSNANAYDKATSKRAVFSHAVSKKWREIMDPYQYVDKQEDGTYKIKKGKREHEDWGRFGKLFSKKIGDVSDIRSKYMNSNYLFGIDEKVKKDFSEQYGLITSQLAGFFGLLVGIPAAIQDTKIGLPILAVGVHQSVKAHNSSGKMQERKLRGYSMDASGKWHFVGYGGKSVQTIADGMQAMARENYDQIEREKQEHDIGVVEKTRKHKKLYSRMENIVKNPGNIKATRGRNGEVKLHDVANIDSTPMAIGQVLRVGKKSFAGRLISHSRLAANAYMGYVKSMGDLRKKAGKEWKQELSTTETMLGYMAARYFATEVEKQEEVINEKAEQFETTYRREVEKIENEVDNMDDVVLRYETNYDDKYEVKTNNEGKKTLTTDSEKKIIDKAIIEVVAKSGLSNLNDYNMNNGSNKDAVKSVITDILIGKGIIDKTQTADDLIRDLDKKIVLQKDTLERERPEAIEDKIIDDSIIELLKEQESVQDSTGDSYFSSDNNTSNNVNTNGRKDTRIETSMDDKIADKVKKKIHSMVGMPSSETSSAVEKMKGQSSSSLETSTQTNVDELSERIKSKISERREKITKKAENPLRENERKKLKESLTKKKVRKLDAILYSSQLANMENSDTASIGTATETSETDSAQSGKKVDDVVKMLELQTEIYKAQNKREFSEIKVSEGASREEKVHAYKAMLFNSDGSVNVKVFGEGTKKIDAENDGSIRLNKKNDGTRRVNTANDGSMRVNGREYSSQQSKDAEKTLLEIINRVNREKNI